MLPRSWLSLAQLGIQLDCLGVGESSVQVGLAILLGETAVDMPDCRSHLVSQSGALRFNRFLVGFNVQRLCGHQVCSVDCPFGLNVHFVNASAPLGWRLCHFLILRGVDFVVVDTLEGVIKVRYIIWLFVHLFHERHLDIAESP